MMKEQRSRNLAGMIVGSWVEITTRIPRCLCCRTTDNSDSVRRDDAVFSLKYCDFHEVLSTGLE